MGILGDGAKYLPRCHHDQSELWHQRFLHIILRGSCGNWGYKLEMRNIQPIHHQFYTAKVHYKMSSTHQRRLEINRAYSKDLATHSRLA